MKTGKCIKVMQYSGAFVCAVALYLLWKNQTVLLDTVPSNGLQGIFINGLADALVGLIVGFSMLQHGNIMHLRERIDALEKQGKGDESHTPR